MTELKVLYVASAHCSGTTLLASILGGYDGIFAAGESHEIWQNLIDDQPCGCRLPLDLCPVWGPILREVYERALSAPLTPADAVRWRARSARIYRDQAGSTGRSLAERNEQERSIDGHYLGLPFAAQVRLSSDREVSEESA